MAQHFYPLALVLLSSFVVNGAELVAPNEIVKTGQGLVDYAVEIRGGTAILEGATISLKAAPLTSDRINVGSASEVFATETTLWGNGVIGLGPVDTDPNDDQAGVFYSAIDFNGAVAEGVIARFTIDVSGLSPGDVVPIELTHPTSLEGASVDALIPGSITIAREADFNVDGSVNAQDLGVWQSEFGCLAGCTADADLDGDADGSDFLLWQGLFDAAQHAPASLNHVPEPSALLLCTAIGLAWALSARFKVALFEKPGISSARPCRHFVRR